MGKKGYKIEQMRRREEVAYLMDELSVEELAEYADVSTQTIENDIKYIERHWNQYFN